MVRRKAGSVPDQKPLVEAVCEERIDVTSVTQHGTPGQESVKSGSLRLIGPGVQAAGCGSELYQERAKRAPRSAEAPRHHGEMWVLWG